MNRKGVEIIYKGNKPYGIRDEGGYLLFFSKINRYAGQEERYRREVEEQCVLADKILSALVTDKTDDKEREWRDDAMLVDCPHCGQMYWEEE